MAIIKWNPNTVPSSYDTLFDSFFSDVDRVFGANNLKSTPAANIKKVENGFEIELAVPGVKKENLELEVNENVLTLSAVTSEEGEKEAENWKRREFNYSSFKRSFTLPENFDEEGVKANYEHGVLRVSVPTKEPVKKIKQIEIA